MVVVLLTLREDLHRFFKHCRWCFLVWLESLLYICKLISMILEQFVGAEFAGYRLIVQQLKLLLNFDYVSGDFIYLSL